MPQFILPKKQLLLEDLHSIDIRKNAEETIFTATAIYSTRSVYIQDIIEKLSQEELEIFSSAVELAILQSGQMIKFEDAAIQIALCGPGGMPLEILWGSSDFPKFLNRVDKHPLPPGFMQGDYNKSLHFYLGKSAGKTDFNVVIVPAFDKFNGDLSVDPFVENRSFTHDNPFFAYVMPATSLGIPAGSVGIMDKNTDCMPFIVEKDTLPDKAGATQVVSFSFENFMDFINNLISKPPLKFFLQFGRVKLDGNLIIILSFLNDDGPIRSNVTDPATQGVCFDKGDLIPPPDDAAKWDSSF